MKQPEPTYDGVDPKTGKKWADYTAYEQGLRAWRSQKTTEGQLLGFGVLALLAFAGWAGVTEVVDLSKGHAVVSANAADPRDQQIKELTARIAQIEAKPVDHHYELRQDGLRTFRFDPTTGDTCIQLTTKHDWKNPATIREGCPYQDFIAAGPADPQRHDEAECWFVGNMASCSEANKPR